MKHFVLFLIGFASSVYVQAQSLPMHSILESLELEKAGKVHDAVTNLPFEKRVEWHYVPLERKGLPKSKWNAAQQKQIDNLLRTVLSERGLQKTYQIMDLEHVLRVIENRTTQDTYRDPDKYTLLTFGNLADKQWAWRLEGHHLSLNFTIVNNQVRFLPAFMGSNPAEVQIDHPQKGLQVLKEESTQAFRLLESLTTTQLEKAKLANKAPDEIFTQNARRGLLERKEGIAYKDLSKAQKVLFKELIDVYLSRYHVTLKKQQWQHLEKKGLNEIYFAWMGDTTPGFGVGKGHYYRIHGPTLLIEYDNIQNNGNHIHTVIRDLEHDFGDDLLGVHYQQHH